MGSKNLVLKFRSVRSIVIAPANTGKDNSNKTVVIKIDQTKRGNCSKLKILNREFKIVAIKLIDLIIEETPAKCKEKIIKSIELLK
jgi:hypothetical protein